MVVVFTANIKETVKTDRHLFWKEEACRLLNGMPSKNLSDGISYLAYCLSLVYPNK